MPCEKPAGLQRLHSGNAGAVFGKAAAGEAERTGQRKGLKNKGLSE